MEKIISSAKLGLPFVTKALSQIVSCKSLSGREKEAAAYLVSALKDVGCDEVRLDGLGSVVARIGNGPRIIAMDAHIDVVDVGDLSQWTSDPFKPVVKGSRLYGRGAADQKAGMASLILAAKLMVEHGLVPESCSVVITGTVMEEDCDGMCWKYLIEEEGIKPEVAIITEPTSLKINRGHRGRMEIEATVRGKSAHGSAPERGQNAVYKMAKIVGEIEKMGKRGGEDFLGKGTVVVSRISSSGPSLCAVPDICSIYLDRRLGLDETKKAAVGEIEAIGKSLNMDLAVDVPVYEGVAYTGKKYRMEKFFPPWLVEEKHPCVQSMMKASKGFSDSSKISRWTFSTNATVIAGVYNIPCVGFGPGNEEQAHAADEWVELDDLWKAAAGYAMFPRKYVEA